MIGEIPAAVVPLVAVVVLLAYGVVVLGLALALKRLWRALGE